ncbi:hypothetical protein D3C85_1107520 [compost metagenome]
MLVDSMPCGSPLYTTTKTQAETMVFVPYRIFIINSKPQTPGEVVLMQVLLMYPVSELAFS